MLSDITIVDLSRLLPGPFCTMLLADLGARVIQVEPPVSAQDVTATDFPTLNRNKERIVVNLKSDRGRQVVQRLLAQADALVEGFRPGITARLGVDFDTAHRLNPKLVYCSITGYGQDSKRAHKAGHDVNFLAVSGVLDLMITNQDLPTIPAVQFADVTGAMQAALYVLAAIHRARRTGEGKRIDVSMTDAMLPLAVTSITFKQMGWPHQAGTSMVGGGLACYQVYRTSDGRLLSVGALEAVFFARLCRALGVEELIPLQYALPKQAALKDRLQEVFSSRTYVEWVEFFAGLDACVEGVARFEEALEERQFRASGAVRQGTADDGRPVLMLGSPNCPNQRAATDALPPDRGTHTDAVLHELGYSREEQSEMREEGAVA